MAFHKENRDFPALHHLNHFSSGRMDGEVGRGQLEGVLDEGSGKDNFL